MWVKELNKNKRRIQYNFDLSRMVYENKLKSNASAHFQKTSRRAYA